MNGFESLEMDTLGEDQEALGETDGEIFENFENFESFENYELMEGDGEQMEGDQFLGKFFKAPKFLRNLAAQAAGAAGQAIAGPTGAKLARSLASRVLNETDMEGDFEEEGSFESDFESAGGDTEALDEANYYAYMAAETPSIAEADQFIGAIANLAAPLLGGLFGDDNERDPFLDDILGGLMGEEGEQGDQFLDDILGGLMGEEGEMQEGDQFLPALIPLAAQLLPAAMPFVKKGIQAVGKALIKGPGRQAVKALPRIAAKTVGNLARQAQRGVPIKRQHVIANLARETTKTLGSKRRLANAVRHNRVAAARAQQRPLVTSMPAPSRGGMVRPMAPRPGARPAITRPGPLGGGIASPAQAGIARPIAGGVATPAYRPGGYRGSPTGRRSRLIGYVPVYAPRR